MIVSKKVEMVDTNLFAHKIGDLIFYGDDEHKKLVEFLLKCSSSYEGRIYHNSNNVIALMTSNKGLVCIHGGELVVQTKDNGINLYDGNEAAYYWKVIKE